MMPKSGDSHAPTSPTQIAKPHSIGQNQAKGSQKQPQRSKDHVVTECGLTFIIKKDKECSCFRIQGQKKKIVEG